MKHNFYFQDTSILNHIMKKLFLFQALEGGDVKITWFLIRMCSQALKKNCFFCIFPAKVGLRILTKVGNMLSTTITDQMWLMLAPILKEFKIHFSYGIRTFMIAVFWNLRTGAPWRDLPTEFGSQSTIFNKFNRWTKTGIWQKLLLKIRGELDKEWNFIDSTIINSHQHSVNSSDKKIECVGRAVCGNSRKLHILSDSHENPINFIISEGQTHDSKIANKRIEISESEHLIINRTYNDQKIRKKLEEKNIQSNIPKKSNTIYQKNDGFDKKLHKIRHLVDNLFVKLNNLEALQPVTIKVKITLLPLFTLDVLSFVEKFENTTY